MNSRSNKGNMCLGLLLAIGIIFSALSAIAQPYTIKITGRVDTALSNKFKADKLIVKQKETPNIDAKTRHELVQLQANGAFEFELSLVDSLVYLSFEMEDKSSSSRQGYVYNVSFPRNIELPELYLFKTGDEVNIWIKKDGSLQFSGKGSEKLNCQWQIYATEPFPKPIKNRLIALLNNKEQSLYFLTKYKAVKAMLILRLAILESYHAQLPTDVYKLIYLDVLVSANHFGSLPWANEKKQVIPLSSPAKDSLAERLSQALKEDRLLQIKSAYYTEYLLERELDGLQTAQQELANNGQLAHQLYQRLTTQYTGQLKEKLLLAYFVKVGTKNTALVKGWLADTEKQLENLRYIALLRYWKLKTYLIPPFEFYDDKDRPFRLAEHKGKVIVIDFWFTGCMPCQQLSTAMHNIMEQYKDHPEVVFVTVSTDPKATWLKSLASGKYTAVNSVNLYTKSLGWSHPLIKNYGFTSFPQQLIIDQKGELVSSSPPRPDQSEAAAKAFIEIIANTLSNDKFHDDK